SRVVQPRAPGYTLFPYTTLFRSPGHPGAGQAVEQKDQGNDGQGRAKGTPGGFQQQRNAHAGGHQIQGGQAAGALGQLLVEDEQVGGAGGGHQGQRDVGRGHIGTGRALEGRIGQEGQQQS